MKCFGGFLAKYMGDGVLVYFGFPQAHQGYRWAAAAAPPVGNQLLLLAPSERQWE